MELRAAGLCCTSRLTEACSCCCACQPGFPPPDVGLLVKMPSLPCKSMTWQCTHLQAQTVANFFLAFDQVTRHSILPQT